MRYAALGPGKRLRPFFALETGKMFDLPERPVLRAACALECIHAYSLVHDDLPAMDDDDMRRGRPTVHRVHGVAAATAAGLAMVPLAALCAAEACVALALPEEATTAVVRDLMVASGAGGMIGGQLLDLEGEGSPLALEDLQQIHCAKTGALIAAAATIGGRAAGAPPEALTALAQYGEDIGLAFQIADDVLDVTSTTSQLGKTAGRDLELRKSTYPALLGVEGARARAVDLVEQGCSALEQVGLLTPALSRIAHFTVERTS
jgi:geranylgeranyl pyrophosphate synthase